MSLDRCLELARGMGVPDGQAHDLCRDPDLQRCATFALPEAGDDRSLEAQFDNFAACYGRAASGERRL